MIDLYMGEEAVNTYCEDVVRFEKAVLAYERVKQIREWGLKDSVEKRFALETVVGTIGMTRDNTLTLEGFGDKIRLYGNRVWGRIKKFMGAVKKRVRGAWRWARGTSDEFVANKEFLGDYEAMLRKKLDHHDAEAAIQRIHKALIVAYLSSHEGAYKGNLVKFLRNDDGFVTNLAFRTVKVTREGKNFSGDSGEAEQMEGNQLLKYTKELKEIGELCAKRLEELENIVGDSVGDAVGKEARFRRRMLVTTAEMALDAKMITLTSSYVKNAIRVLNTEYAISGLGKVMSGKKKSDAEHDQNTKEAERAIKLRKRQEKADHKYRYG